MCSPDPQAATEAPAAAPAAGKGMPLLGMHVHVRRLIGCVRPALSILGAVFLTQHIFQQVQLCHHAHVVTTIHENLAIYHYKTPATAAAGPGLCMPAIFPTVYGTACI